MTHNKPDFITERELAKESFRRTPTSNDPLTGQWRQRQLADYRQRRTPMSNERGVLVKVLPHTLPVAEEEADTILAALHASGYAIVPEAAAQLTPDRLAAALDDIE